jgi:hypothetical protein
MFCWIAACRGAAVSARLPFCRRIGGGRARAAPGQIDFSDCHVPDFVAIIAGFEARSAFGSFLNHSEAWQFSRIGQSQSTQLRLWAIASRGSDKSSVGPFTRATLETGTG